MHAYSLELGHLLRFNVKKKIGAGKWEAEVNQVFLGEFDTIEDAFNRAEQEVRERSHDFLDDWTIWTTSARVGPRMPKGWW